MAATIHGLFFGRVAPSSRARRQIQAPALVVGHPHDPIHLAADAIMVAEELPNARHVGADEHPRVAAAPGPPRPGGDRLRHGGVGRPGSARAGGRAAAGRMGSVPYYRDEAIVLRTQKLGEADRIVTLLTRSHGRVRAVAKGVRRTTSRFGARLEPFSHVDVQLAEARSLDVVTQAETLQPYAGRMGADYAAYTAGTVMLETAERLVAEDKEPALQQYLLLVGALRAICDAGRPPGPGARRVPAAVARGRRLRAVVRRVRPLRRRGAARGVQPLGRRDAVPGLPAARARRGRPRRRSRVLAALLSGDWDVVLAADDAAPARGEHAGRGVPRLAPRARAEVAQPPAALSRAARSGSTRRSAPARGAPPRRSSG